LSETFARLLCQALNLNYVINIPDIALKVKLGPTVKTKSLFYFTTATDAAPPAAPTVLVTGSITLSNLARIVEGTYK
jgi:hypothetical protein